LDPGRAVLVTLFSIGHGMTLILMMISSLAIVADTPPSRCGIESSAASFQPIQMLPLIPSLLLAPTFISYATAV
jgi:hypothetical protein